MRKINCFFLSGILLISMGLISCEKQESKETSPPSHAESSSPDEPNGPKPHKPPPPPCQPRETSDQPLTACDEALSCEPSESSACEPSECCGE